MPRPSLPPDYPALLEDLKRSIRAAQVRAALAVNRELVLLYWHIGRQILQRQKQEGWGAQVIDRLSQDLRSAFPDMQGFSPRNLKYMRAFAESWPDGQFVQQVVAQIPWGHHVRILDKVPEPDARRFYIQQTIENGWSRNVLVHHIETRLHLRQGQAITNFATALPSPQSDLAQQLLKDPYTFDFLSLEAAARERELERGLVAHMRDFLLELGVGFSFVGSQYHLVVQERDFYLDLLFYHLRLRCFVVIELKAGEFEPEHVGKLNFYLSAVDDLLRHPADNPSIGILLCKSRDRVFVEYALRNLNSPLGVSTFQLSEALPETLQGQLPSVADLEAQLGEIEE